MYKFFIEAFDKTVYSKKFFNNNFSNVLRKIFFSQKRDNLIGNESLPIKH